MMMTAVLLTLNDVLIAMRNEFMLQAELGKNLKKNVWGKTNVILEHFLKGPCHRKKFFHI